MPTESRLNITLVYSPTAREVKELHLDLPLGSTVAQALAGQEAQEMLTGLNLSEASLGIWGKKTLPNRLLRDQDRIEVYRPLKVNPKVARRERFAKQGARTTGLFAKKRAGAKAGY